MTERIPEQSFVPAVQGLRGFAAFSVIVVHLYVMPLLAGLLPELPAWVHATVNTGGRGVELFFIISGYLIPASLVRHGELGRFFYDRAMRIMPLFVLLHLVLFVLGPIVGYKFFAGIDALGYARAFLANLFFVPEIVGEPLAQQNAWTLTYEWLFYIWFAAIFTLAVRRRSLAWGLPLLVAGIALAIAFPRASYFAVGMVFAWFPMRLGVPGAAGLALGAAAVAALYALCEYVTPYAGLVFGALVFALVLHPRSGVAAFLTTRPLMFLGKISYSLYLVHPFIFFAGLAVARRLVGTGLSPWLVWALFAIASTAGAILASTVLFELVEQRLRRAIDRWIRGRRPAAQAAMPGSSGLRG